jgi:hypothetical protein
MKLIEESGEGQLLAQEALVAFQDYQWLDHLIGPGPYSKVVNFVSNLPPSYVRQDSTTVEVRAPVRLPAVFSITES